MPSDIWSVADYCLYCTIEWLWREIKTSGSTPQPHPSEKSPPKTRRFQLVLNKTDVPVYYTYAEKSTAENTNVYSARQPIIYWSCVFGEKCLCRRFLLVMRKGGQWKDDRCRLLVSPTNKWFRSKGNWRITVGSVVYANQPRGFLRRMN